MTVNLTQTPPPFPWPTSVVEERETALYTGTACLAVMDTEFIAEVWEDILYDGYEHEHGPGGLMLNSGSVGTHLEHDGDFPVVVSVDGAGRAVAFRVDLDPYRDDLDSLRRPAGWTAEDEQHLPVAHPAHDHGHDHGHAHDGDGHDHGSDDEHGHGHHVVADGWSEPVTVRLVTETAVLGDPAGLPQADDTGGLLDLAFPAPAGTLQVSVYYEAGIRRDLLAVWAA